MNAEQIKNKIESGRASLGIEFGSTRIKAVLIDEEYNVLAKGSHTWENRLENGVWTYHTDDIIKGMQDCYRSMAEDARERCGAEITKLKSLGISGMMHGYMPFDKEGNLLVPFRTWRNTMTARAAEKLSKLFSFNIPQRWSIAHLYEAILNKEEHISSIFRLTTLAGYVHGLLGGENVLGVGEASGMFPIDDKTLCYDAEMALKFDKILEEEGLPFGILDILPKVLPAGECAGTLSEEGAKLLDPTGKLVPGIMLCPPEGDAGTGMVATNSVSVRTGNISAGTSIFAMAVLEKNLSGAYPEIDVVTTPAGAPVAMVHCNNCTTDINAWAELLCQFAKRAGVNVSLGEALDILFEEASDGEYDCGGLLSYNYYSGEHTTGFSEGRPLFARTPDAELSLPNFARVNMYSAIATLKLGMDILFEKEHVSLDKIYGHGGFFKATESGQRIMAAAINIPVSVMNTANDGGAFGMAVLASFAANKKEGQSLEGYLKDNVFAGCGETSMQPDQKEAKGFADYAKRYKEGFVIESAAVSAMKLK